MSEQKPNAVKFQLPVGVELCDPINPNIKIRHIGNGEFVSALNTDTENNFAPSHMSVCEATFILGDHTQFGDFINDGISYYKVTPVFDKLFYIRNGGENPGLVRKVSLSIVCTNDGQLLPCEPALRNEKFLRTLNLSH